MHRPLNHLISRAPTELQDRLMKRLDEYYNLRSSLPELDKQTKRNINSTELVQLAKIMQELL